MTPEQEYEEAVEEVAIAIFNADEDYEDLTWDECGESIHSTFEDMANHILSLTWPSGQPMIAVMARDQGFRALTALMPPERKIGFDLAMGEMKEAGFRRVVKQEAK